ncbi:MAG TPA: SHOCT domain-containing protein [Acidimicrobiales bacterium]|nr:SHOCT domain-containing protein [Acidimicrobiales bacterium]
MTGSDYPLLNAFWTIFLFFLFVFWLFILFRIIFDIFRSHDLGGWGKALWFIFILFLPFLGVVVYLIARGGKMHERDVQMAQAQDQAFRSYVKEATGSSADELAKLADLKAKGVITDAEFEQAKAKLLS